MTLGWLRPTLLCLAVPVALAGCSGVENAQDVRVPDAGPTCRTDGTVKADTAPSIAAAVQPYRKPGQKLRIVRKLPGTATVQLHEGKVVQAVITLVRTKKGWAATSISTC